MDAGGQRHWQGLAGGSGVLRRTESCRTYRLAATNAPDTNGKPAIDTDYFSSTSIKNENDQDDWPFYWTSTTLETWNNKGDKAVFVAFGRALGYMSNTWVNIHGAGAVKADFKSGDPADHPTGDGPQNGAVRIYNYVRCVRDAGV